VLDIFVPQIVLQGAGVVAIVCKLEPAGMPEHVRMDCKRHLGALAEALNEMMEAHWADRPATFANEYVGFCRVVTPFSSQSAISYLSFVAQRHRENLLQFFSRKIRWFWFLGPVHTPGGRRGVGGGWQSESAYHMPAMNIVLYLVLGLLFGALLPWLALWLMS